MEVWVAMCVLVLVVGGGKGCVRVEKPSCSALVLVPSCVVVTRLRRLLGLSMECDEWFVALVGMKAGL